MTKVILEDASRVDKKYKVTLKGHQFSFGHPKYEDFTVHGEEARKQSYLKRMGSSNQDWGITGVATPGFWARWLLWNKPTLAASIKDMERRFKLRIENRIRDKLHDKEIEALLRSRKKRLPVRYFRGLTRAQIIHRLHEITRVSARSTTPRTKGSRSLPTVMWADRVQRAKASGGEGAVVQLHKQRFQAWRAFIDYYARITESEQEEKARNNNNNNDLEKSLSSVSFAKITLWRGKTPHCVFDASFGSMDVTSDLDVTVISTNAYVVERWVSFLEWLYRQSDEKKIPYLVPAGVTFTNYYDSNFYMDPGKVRFYESGRPELRTLMELQIEDVLPNKTTAVSQMQLIERYCNAYVQRKPLRVEMKPSGAEEKAFPNPDAKGFGRPQEVEQYKLQCKYALRCLKPDGFTLQNISNLYACKTEGLICPGSLAIVKVLGDEKQQCFMTGVNNKGGLCGPKDQTWRLVTAFEMLCNLKMHASDSQIKTKYLKRLDDALSGSVNRCKPASRLSKEVNKVFEKSKEHNKKVGIKAVLGLISEIVEDEINLTACPQRKNPTYYLHFLESQLMLVRNEIIHRYPHP